MMHSMRQSRRQKSLKMELVKAKDKPVRIIEVFTDRQANVKAHRDLWTQITDRLDHDE